MAIIKTNYEAKAILLLGLAILVSNVAGSAFQDGFGGRRGLVESGDAAVFDITNYGAKGDGNKDNLEAFMQAWQAACHSTSPAKLVIPPGTFKTGPVVFAGPCQSPDSIIFEIQGTILATTDVSDYSSPEWLSFDSINGLIIRGGGTFDGQGAAVWKYNDCRQNPDCALLPDSIKLNKLTNAVVQGISSVNSKAFHFHVTNSQSVTFQSINVTAPANSPNTDGIHLSRSSLVNISDSVIGTGDDCISIGQGCTNVSIAKITCGPGHGISVGSLGKYPNEADVRGIVVSNCTFLNTTNGARIKTYPGSPPSAASGIYFEDLIMDIVKNPIIIDQKYGSHKSDPSKVKISDVHFTNIKGTSVSPVAVNLMCSEVVPCQDVQVSDIDLAYNGRTVKGLSFQSSCLHAQVSFGGKLNPPACP